MAFTSIHGRFNWEHSDEPSDLGYLFEQIHMAMTRYHYTKTFMMIADSEFIATPWFGATAMQMAEGWIRAR